jgi:type II secretory pathway pseudopilin PulG
MNPRVSHQKTAALTLVEVLVVIAVLFVLATLILPNLAGSHTARRSLCVQNLKQIDLAFHVWAGDHGDKFPMQVSVTDGGTMELNDGRNALATFLVMSNDFATPKVLWCPADKDHALATDFTAGFSSKNVSYFVGLDAADNFPKSLLSGDDNFAIGGIPIRPGLLKFLTNAPIVWTASSETSWGPRALEFPTNASIVWTDERHINVGNIGLTDGSVRLSNNSNLADLLHQTGVANYPNIADLLHQTGVATNRLTIP